MVPTVNCDHYRMFFSSFLLFYVKVRIFVLCQDYEDCCNILSGVGRLSVRECPRAVYNEEKAFREYHKINISTI